MKQVLANIVDGADRFLKATLGTCCFLLALSQVAFCQTSWLNTAGPYWGEILTVGQVGNHVYAGASGSNVAFSTDLSFSNWQPVDAEGIRLRRPRALFRSTSGYDFIAADHYLLRTPDSGQNWKVLDVSWSFQTIGEIDGVLFGGLNNLGLLQSLDWGETWIPTIVENVDVFEMASSENAVFASVSDSQTASFRDGVYVFRREQPGWFPLSTTPLGIDIHALVVWEEALIAGTENGLWIYQGHSDVGWKRLGSPSPNSSVRALLLDSVRGQMTLYHSVGSRIYATTNLVDWEQVGPTLQDSVTELAILDSSRIVAGLSEEGIVELSNFETRPYWKTVGLPLSDAVSFTDKEDVILSAVIAAVGISHSGVWKSTDDGRTWIPTTMPANYTTTDVEINGHGSWFVRTSSGLWNSSDQGETWLLNPLEDLRRFDVGPEGWVYGTVTKCATCNEDIGLWRSRHGTGEWEYIWPGDMTHIFVAEQALIGGKCGPSGTSVLVSFDQFATWNETYVPGCPILFAEHGSSIYVGIRTSGTLQLLVSDDYFKSWEPVYEQWNFDINGLDVDGSGRLLISNEDVVLTSVDAGNSWDIISDSLPTDGDNICNIRTLRLSPQNHVIVGTEECGIYRTVSPMEESTGVGDSLPQENSNLRVYPNPATDFIVVESDAFEVEILDVLGRVVLRSNPTHPLEISSLPAGVYYVKAGGLSERFTVFR